MIEVAGDADPRGVRGPHREARSGDAAPRLELCAEPLVQPAMRTLGHQVDVDVAQHRREAIRVLLLPAFGAAAEAQRSEEHTSELQSLMRISYAVFCLKKKKHKRHRQTQQHKTIRHGKE